jgi:putative ubiquitin-RnfH superfamily antitoxin RatB of RatAB toxin-antitoxin module
MGVKAETIPVEVVYALPQEQFAAQFRVEAGTSIGEAIERSGVLARFPEIDLQSNAVGVFGCLRRLEERVAAGDRIEIYRALRADPKSTRRQRAARTK